MSRHVVLHLILLTTLGMSLSGGLFNLHATYELIGLTAIVLAMLRLNKAGRDAALSDYPVFPSAQYVSSGIYIAPLGVRLGRVVVTAVSFVGFLVAKFVSGVIFRVPAASMRIGGYP